MPNEFFYPVLQLALLLLVIRGVLADWRERKLSGFAQATVLRGEKSLKKFTALFWNSSFVFVGDKFHSYAEFVLRKIWSIYKYG